MKIRSRGRIRTDRESVLRARFEENDRRERERIREMQRDAAAGRVRLYRPGFFTGFEDVETTAQNAEELLSLPWVKEWEAHDGFVCWVKATGVPSPYASPDMPKWGHLVGVFDGGAKWWVRATLSDATKYDLPEWKGPEPRAPQDRP